MKTPIRRALPFLAVLAALAILGAPAGADEVVDGTADLAIDPATAATGSCPTPSAAIGGTASQDADALAFCQADCEDGTTISVNCSGSCQAVDQNCPNVRGHVACNGTITDRCPICETPACQAERECPDGTYLFCQGTSECLGGNGLCFVRCDGNYQFCPGHFGEIIC